jgi:hypothetical protein
MKKKKEIRGGAASYTALNKTKTKQNETSKSNKRE